MSTTLVPRVLVVDDETKIREIVTSYLEHEGYDVNEAADGETALHLAARFKPDLVVLDVMMPGIDGLEVLRRLRSTSEVYVILLTARTEELDKLIGLSVGADDYVEKPFSPRELVARVKAVLRRGARHDPQDIAASGDVLTFEGLSIDMIRREVRHETEPIELTTLEFDLLAAFASSPGRVFTRRQLLERVWGWDFVGDERIVDVHIANLRRALHDRAAAPRWIGTVRGAGYKFVATPT
jgi:DNA-binding response OmpR family regulator